MGEMVQIEGLVPLQSHLFYLDTMGVRFAARPVAQFSERMVRTLTNEPYPARLPNQKYIRTYLLKNSFRQARLEVARHLIQNTAPRRRYAIGPKQAEIHQGRWWTMKEIVERDLPDLRLALGEAYVEAIVHGR
jgi:hypothetical protein